MSQETNFNIEIAKIVGEEVAKQALGRFTEEQLQELVDKSIKNLTVQQKVNPNDSWCKKYKDSKLDENVARSLWAEVSKKIEERIASEEHQKQVQEMADQMMDEILKQTRMKMVADMSNRMANFAMNNNGPGALNWEFDQYMRSFISNLPRPY